MLKNIVLYFLVRLKLEKAGGNKLTSKIKPKKTTFIVKIKQQ